MNGIKEQIPEGTRMASIVIQCVEAVQIAHGVSFEEIRTMRLRTMSVVLARYSLFTLLIEETKLGVREIEKMMGMSKGNSYRFRKIISENNSPVFDAVRKANRKVFNEVVKIQYDEKIPF